MTFCVTPASSGLRVSGVGLLSLTWNGQMASKLEIKRELEWRACKNDLVYFLSKYWKVATIGSGYDTFSLFDYQHEDAVAFQAACEGDAKQRQVRLKARQLGWTTLATGGAFWSAFFYEHHPWLVTAQGEKEAADTLSTKIKIPYSLLPVWMRKRGAQVTQETQEVMQFDNGSRVMVVPSTSSAGRGQAIFGALMDEAAFMPDSDELFAAIDPMCYGPLFMFSTANGMGNFFHATWLESQLEDSEWKGKFHPWSNRPGRDEAWYEAQKRKYRGREHLFFQEFPSTPEEAFMRSGRTALPMDLLRDDEHWCPPRYRVDLGILRTVWDKGLSIEQEIAHAVIPEDQTRDMELHVWQEPYVERDDDGRPRRDPNYVVGVDVAEGLDHGDFSAISVLDANTGEQCATVKSHIPVHDLADYAEFLGYWYHTALVGVERNNHGLLPLSQLQDRAYPRMYRMESIAQIKTGDRTVRYGYHTNKATKPKMVNDFNQYLIDGWILLHDARFLHEASTFLSDGKGGYGASVANHDDLVMASFISLQLALDVGTYPIIWRDPEPGPPSFGEIFDVMMEKDDEEQYEGLALAAAIGQEESPDVARVRHSFELLLR